MKSLLTFLIILLSGLGIWAQTSTPGKLAGTYEYRVNTEFANYLSTLTIKSNGHYEREIRSNGTRKTTGKWEIKGETLWLTPDKKYKLEPYSMLIGNGYLKIGEVGVHEKVK